MKQRARKSLSGRYVHRRSSIFAGQINCISKREMIERRCPARKGLWSYEHLRKDISNRINQAESSVMWGQVKTVDPPDSMSNSYTSVESQLCILPKYLKNRGETQHALNKRDFSSELL